MKKNEIDPKFESSKEIGIEKTNIRSESNKLEIDKVDFYEALFTDGVVIEKTNMSNYIQKCYDYSDDLQCGIHCDLTYQYYVDEVNNSCVLFTSLYSDHEDDDEGLLLKEDFIVVKIYVSPEHFMVGSLAEFYQKNYVDEITDSCLWTDSGCFQTNSNNYNQFPIIKAVSKLLTEQQIIRKKTIDNIINS